MAATLVYHQGLVTQGGWGGDVNTAQPYGVVVGVGGGWWSSTTGLTY